MIEHEVIKESLQLVGYPSMPHADGITCPGGSMANMYGMIMARYNMFPEIKKVGASWLDKPLACLTSQDSHYSILKAAHWLGVGTDNVHKVQLF